jgi:hypothetical protein
MKAAEWIVLEHSGRWAAALRTAFRRQLPSHTGEVLLHEARSFAELNEQVGKRSYTMVLMEITPANFEAVLSWLADRTRSLNCRHVIGLLDGEFTNADGSNDDSTSNKSREVEGALFEAGIVGITRSPRRLQDILRLGLQCADRDARGDDNVARYEALSDWAWAQLPWQEAI